MKKSVFMWSIPLLGMLCPACASDDNGPDVLKVLTIYGENYLLGQAAIWQDDNYTVCTREIYVFEDCYQLSGEEHTDRVEGYMTKLKDRQTGNFTLGIYEDGFIINEILLTAQGKGACVCLQMASPDTKVLKAGKYIFSENREEYTFCGYSSSDYDVSDVYFEPTKLASGEVNVKREGGVYIIDFDCKTTFGGTVKGTYTGKPSFYNLQGQTKGVKYYKNIVLKALADTVAYVDERGNAVKEPDYLRGTSFLNSSRQQIYNADQYRKWSEDDKGGIDIAVRYERKSGTVCFESPLKMRAYLWHNRFGDYNFDLPCHTMYMSLPSGFTDENFEAMAAREDFVFPFSGEEVHIPIGINSSRFVMVVTGNGQIGVIRVKVVRPPSTEVVQGIEYPVDPMVVIDLKFPHTFLERKIR